MDDNTNNFEEKIIELEKYELIELDVNHILHAKKEVHKNQEKMVTIV